MEDKQAEGVDMEVGAAAGEGAEAEEDAAEELHDALPI